MLNFPLYSKQRRPHSSVQCCYMSRDCWAKTRVPGHRAQHVGLLLHLSITVTLVYCQSVTGCIANVTQAHTQECSNTYKFDLWLVYCCTCVLPGCVSLECYQGVFLQNVTVTRAGFYRMLRLRECGLSWVIRRGKHLGCCLFITTIWIFSDLMSFTLELLLSKVGKARKTMTVLPFPVFLHSLYLNEII